MINVASKVAAQFDIQNKGHRVAVLEYSGRAILSKWLQYRFDSIQVEVTSLSHSTNDIILMARPTATTLFKTLLI